MNIDIKKEIPADQQWVSYPEFEAKLYDKQAILLSAIPLTRGPKFHWFSYYDKFETDPAERYVLAMEVDFEGRSPAPDDTIRIGMIDMSENNKWIELGTSCAWSWQQGCMFQWRPGSAHEVLWNDRQDGQFVCHILDTRSGKKRTLPHAVYHVHPDGKLALCADFARIEFMRPGYGYAGIEDPYKTALAPASIGMRLMDLDSGRTKDVFSYEQIAAIPYPQMDPNDDRHYMYVFQWSPDGKRFVFLNRWRSAAGKWPGFRTRMFSSALDGTDLRLVTDKPLISHFTWRDPRHIAMWRDGAYRICRDDGSYREETILEATNGHLSFFADTDWMIADTYHDKHGNQNLYLYHIPTKRVIPLGHFHTPEKYRGGELRCDLHPRITRSGKNIIIDSTHGGNGRQLYFLDIGAIMKKTGVE